MLAAILGGAHWLLLDFVGAGFVPGARHDRDSGDERQLPEHEGTEPDGRGRIVFGRRYTDRGQHSAKRDAAAARYGQDGGTTAGEATPLPDRLSAWRKALGIAPPTAHELWNQALGTAAGSVKVLASGVTRIVDLRTDSTSPKLAADFVNTLAEEFIEQNLEARWQSTEHTGEWLTNQLRDLRVKLKKSQDELQSYAASSGLMVTQEKDSVDCVEAGGSAVGAFGGAGRPHSQAIHVGDRLEQPAGFTAGDPRRGRVAGHSPDRAGSAQEPRAAARHLYAEPSRSAARGGADRRPRSAACRSSAMTFWAASTTNTKRRRGARN